jgi:hypothetical protein
MSEIYEAVMNAARAVNGEASADLAEAERILVSSADGRRVAKASWNSRADVPV